VEVVAVDKVQIILVLLVVVALAALEQARYL